MYKISWISPSLSYKLHSFVYMTREVKGEVDHLGTIYRRSVHNDDFIIIAYLEPCGTKENG